MACVIISLHSKQPKRGTIAFDKGYVEIYDYPRADEAVITYTEDGSKKKSFGREKAGTRFYMRRWIWNRQFPERKTICALIIQKMLWRL